jgi:transposase
MEEIIMSQTFDIEIGLDLHKNFSVLAAIDQSGQLLSMNKLTNNTIYFDNYFKHLNSHSFRVTFEATRGFYWLADYLTKKKIPFIVSNPFLNRAIANVHAKNDKFDAKILADLTRSNLIAKCYVASVKIRELREIISHRNKLVQISTKLKNKIHLILAQYNYIPPYSEMFGPNGISWILSKKYSEVNLNIIKETLDFLDVLKPKILALERTIKEKVHEHPYYRLLLTVPGIGVLNAAVIISRIEDINRFPKVDKFIRYAGLSVNTRASADKIHLGKLNKRSDKYLRTVFVESAITAVQKDPGLSEFYKYLKSQKGNGIARVAVARKLARSVYFVLKKSEPYHFRSIQPKWDHSSG